MAMISMAMATRERKCAFRLVVVVVVVVASGLAQLAGPGIRGPATAAAGSGHGMFPPWQADRCTPIAGHWRHCILGRAGWVIGMYPHPRQAGCITPNCQFPASWSHACRLAEPRDLQMT